MSQDEDTQERKLQIVRLVISRRERAPRSPRMERAFKRLIRRYNEDLAEARKHAFSNEEADR